jgi:hypothetical protein
VRIRRRQVGSPVAVAAAEPDLERATAQAALPRLSTPSNLNPGTRVPSLHSRIADAIEGDDLFLRVVDLGRRET